MIQIDRLRMHLPPGFEHRATSIASQVGERLAKKHITGDRELESLSLTTRRVPLNSSDDEIAALVVEQIVANIEGKQ